MMSGLSVPAASTQRAPVLHDAHEVELGASRLFSASPRGDDRRRGAPAARGGSWRFLSPPAPRRRPRSLAGALSTSSVPPTSGPLAHAREAQLLPARDPRDRIRPVVPDARSRPPSMAGSHACGARMGVTDHVVPEPPARRERDRARVFSRRPPAANPASSTRRASLAPTLFAFRPERLGEASSSRTDGCSWYARAWTSSLRRTSPSRTLLITLACGLVLAPCSARPRRSRAREPLRQVVVKLAGQQRALVFRGLDQALAQVAQRSSACFRFVMSRRTAERPDSAAVDVSRGDAATW